jgi:hypothetical protein
MSSRKVLLSIGVACLLVGALAGFLYGLGSTPTRTSTSTSTTTVQTVPDAYDQVASSYADHLLLLEARNASAVASQYETNATIEWRDFQADAKATTPGMLASPSSWATFSRGQALFLSQTRRRQFELKERFGSSTPRSTLWETAQLLEYSKEGLPHRTHTSAAAKRGR